jgi:N-acetyl-anhydromuramyl-L-alanine amidase AmpD
VAGRHSIARNASPAREPRASHTRMCNTASIGVSLCCMQGARERPFSAGAAPMTERQWQIAAEVVAEVCRHYRVPVTPRTVLAHGEVQAVLKIEQRQKWDPLVLPWSQATPRDQVMNGFPPGEAVGMRTDHLGTEAFRAQSGAAPAAGAAAA